MTFFSISLILVFLQTRTFSSLLSPSRSPSPSPTILGFSPTGPFKSSGSLFARRLLLEPYYFKVECSVLSRISNSNAGVLCSDCSGINDGDVNKFEDSGIYTCNGLMMHMKKNLTGIKGLSEAKVDKICEAAENHFS